MRRPGLGQGLTAWSTGKLESRSRCPLTWPHVAGTLSVLSMPPQLSSKLTCWQSPQVTSGVSLDRDHAELLTGQCAMGEQKRSRELIMGKGTHWEIGEPLVGEAE